jgi:TPR repeat protein
VAPDTAEALKWYRKAAEQGNASAKNLMGVACQDGDARPGGRGQAKDVVRDPAYAAIFKQLVTQLDAWKADNPSVPVMAGVTPEPAKAEALAAPDDSRRAKRQKKRAVSK